MSYQLSAVSYQCLMRKRFAKVTLALTAEKIGFIDRAVSRAQLTANG
jgi:hypothetical protein